MNNGYIYGIWNIIKHVSIFLLHCGWVLIDQPKNVVNDFLKNDPPHISCYFPFESDSLSKC